jgi:indolepyruvate decarboxylase
MTVSDYLLARLQELGLTHIFAVPGDYAGPFLTTLDATPGIERVPTVTELGAGYAADGYARLRGIGAACVQYGVGTFSLLNCTAGSYVERVPVVVISASPKASDRRLGQEKGILFHHSTGHLHADQQVFAHVTVAAEVIADAGAAPAQIDGALTALLTHRRPVYLEVLQDVWAQPCAAPQGLLAAAAPASNPAALAAALDVAWERLHSARLPVLWAGVEIQRYGLADQLQELVQASGLLFTTTSLGKTVLDESQPQFVGTYAGPASAALTLEVMDNADCILALGTIITDDYLGIMGSAFANMLEVTAEHVRLGQQYYRGVTLPDFLAGLLARYQQLPSPMHALPTVPPTPAPVPSNALTYNSFYDTLSTYLTAQSLTADTVLVLGESTSLYVFGNLMGLPRNGFVAQAAWGSLGHETGCALGVELATGKRPLVIAGDGGFRMVCQELSSLVQQASSAVVFVLSNRGYAIEQAFVDLKGFEPGHEFAAFDQLPTWDYLALAQAFGVRGCRATTVSELSNLLPGILATQSLPTLIEIVVPAQDLAPQLARLAGAPAATGARQQMLAARANSVASQS